MGLIVMSQSELWLQDGAMPRRLISSGHYFGYTAFQFLLPASGQYYVRSSHVTPGIGFPRDIGERYFAKIRALTSTTYVATQFAASVNASGEIGGKLLGTGDMLIYRIPVTQPIRFEVSTSTAVTGVDPHLRVHGAKGAGILAEGRGPLSVDLDPAEPWYVLSVQNANQGAPDRSVAADSFRLNITVTPR